MASTSVLGKLFSKTFLKLLASTSVLGKLFLKTFKASGIHICFVLWHPRLFSGNLFLKTFGLLVANLTYHIHICSHKAIFKNLKTFIYRIHFKGPFFSLSPSDQMFSPVIIRVSQFLPLVSK